MMIMASANSDNCSNPPSMFKWITAQAVLACLLWLPLEFAMAKPDPTAELRRQQEREQQLLEQHRSRPDVRLQTTPSDSVNQRLPEQESPCFVINKLTLQSLDTEGKVLSQHPFLWAAKAANYIRESARIEVLDSPIGRCLGSVGVNTVMKRVQNAIVAEGYITTRVLAVPQDLNKGELILTVIPGRIREVGFSDASIGDAATDDLSSPTALWNALPSRHDERLYLRDIEQGLENLKRVPSAEADIQIAPSVAAAARPGDSDLVVYWKQGRAFRGNVSLDNAGSEGTGKYQGAFTFSYDNPLALNDLFYVSVNNDLGGGMRGARGTRGNTLHYSIPFGYSLASLTASNNNYHQTVAGATKNFVYRGESDNINVTVSRHIYRDAKRKTRWSLAWWRRTSKNFIDDTEVRVQRRRMAGWEMGLHHTAYVDHATIDAELRYRRGTGAWGSLPAPEESANEGSSRPTIIDVGLTVNAPFDRWDQLFTYRGEFKAQLHRGPLVPQDRFSIGSRYTVRGFDGESTLAGDRGWTVRNDLSIRLGQSRHAVYLGADYGAVAGQSSEGLIGKYLGGGALGLKGSIKGMSYDVSVAKPLIKPSGFSGNGGVINARLNWAF